MTLTDWLDYQQRAHPHAIELGLDRVREVWRRLGAPAPAPIVVTVAGTNGKGSTVAFVEAMLAAAGHRVAAYTSPHLLRYNERVRIAGEDASDAALVDAFERIDRARGTISLTYFEWGTLAALLLFAESSLEVAVLEVGLGGRLDAVNLIDADVAIVTTIDLDHQDWLGPDRDTIAREKAGIFRRGRAAIIGDPTAPAALLEQAEAIGAVARLAQRDYAFARTDRGWRWRGWREGDAPPAALELRLPALPAACQVDNAAAAIAALHALRDRLGWDAGAIARGVVGARVPARLQRFEGIPEIVVDVAHNPQAARTLAQWLGDTSTPGRTLAVFGALSDKDVAGVVADVAPRVDRWLLAGLERDSPRGLPADALSRRLEGMLPAATVVSLHADVDAALAAACADARQGDRVLAFGSFLVAAPALGFAMRRSRTAPLAPIQPGTRV
ncbi:MAG: bifunctional tetrahydrofolate synthase/dihydrofolate synthase [Lysobacteraceae bacterium]|nr:MAG: bifunctional tetrahydrofolate synthase/dihydrofolate synthase [Xanthomonadaceae bacterium]